MMLSVLRRLTRVPGVRGLWRRVPLGSIETRVAFDISERPSYAYGAFKAADLAKRLGSNGLSVVEFGVAGGRGLLALEALGDEICRYFDLEIDVIGFDTGKGMPPPTDYRDLPHVWGEGFYLMDERLLRNRLGKAKLVVGDVAATVTASLAALRHPIGFVSFDLDYYSSTKRALGLLKGPPTTRLPRVYCYFDDIIWPEHACHNDHVGELCAIREFNEEEPSLRLKPIHLLRHTRPHPAPWNDQFYVLHDFSHPMYTANLTPTGAAFRQKPLK